MKFNKIFAVPAIMLAFAGFTSCTDEVSYDPATPDEKAGVFFASTTSSTVSLDLDQTTLNVPIYRATKGGAVTAAISSSATLDGQATNVFSVPADVTFADNSDEAVLNIGVNFSAISPNKDYKLTLTIDEASVTEYGKRTITLNVKYAPWSAWGKMSDDGSYTFGGILYSGTAVAVVEKRVNLLNQDNVQYKIPAKGLDDEIFPNPLVFDVNLATNAVSIEMQNTGIKYSTGDDIYIIEAYKFYTEVIDASKLNPPVDPEKYKGLSKFDPETGLLTLNVLYFFLTSDNRVGILPPTYEYLQLPGYPDYEVYISNKGTQINEGSDTESAVIQVTPGSDVSSFSIKLFDGWLSDEECDSIAEVMAADTEIELNSSAGEFSFPMESDGYKTVITVNYNSKGEVVGSSSYTFYYEMQQIDWNAGWKDRGEAIYTDYFVFVDPATWKVKIQESEETPGLFRLVKPYETHPGVSPEDIIRGHFYLTIDASNPNQVYIPWSYTCLGYEVANMAGYLLDKGATDAQVTAQGAWGTFAGDSITFPKNNLLSYDGSGIYMCNDTAVTILKFPKAASDDEGSELSAPVTNSLKSTTAPLLIAGRAEAQYARGVKATAVKTGTKAVIRKSSLKPEYIY